MDSIEERLQKNYYKNKIVEMLKKETDYSEEEIKKMELTLGKYSADDLYRIYDAFYRWGVENILNNVLTL